MARTLAALAAGAAGAQSANAQGDAPPRYAAAQLDCARFLESTRSDIHTEAGGRVRDATAGRDGVWSFRATDTAAGISLEGWYDSLTAWQRSGGATVAPDTDGLIGGRFRGSLGPTGRYHVEVRPFVPDEVTEVVDAAAALDDLFPPLPGRRLEPGQSWRDSTGVEITRLADRVSDRRVQRFALRLRREARQDTLRGDTVPLPLRQTTVEEGEFVWDPVAGLLQRSRELTVETSISAGSRVRQAVRSRVTQQLSLTRLPPAACR